jgi:hypothetical protein
MEKEKLEKSVESIEELIKLDNRENFDKWFSSATGDQKILLLAIKGTASEIIKNYKQINDLRKLRKQKRLIDEEITFADYSMSLSDSVTKMRDYFVKAGEIGMGNLEIINKNYKGFVGKELPK